MVHSEQPVQQHVLHAAILFHTSVSPEEQRWRHIQHILLGCTGLHLRQTCARSAVPILGDLKADLLQCASGNDQTIDAINGALPDTAGPDCDEAARKSTMDLFQDPVQALEGPRAMLLEAAALVAAYITLHGAPLCSNACRHGAHARHAAATPVQKKEKDRL